MITDGVFGNVEYFEDLVASVNQIPKRGNDWFLLANDFATYMDAQVREPRIPPFSPPFSVH